MRNHCIKLIKDQITEHTKNDLFFMTGDLGYSVLEGIAQSLNRNFLNVGIAEANMMSIAAAVGSEGKKVFTYSIIPFTTFRCLEQIRNDICYHDCDVTIIGVGVGYGYGYLGPTHHAIDDLGAMISIPNLTVYSPNDCRELEKIFVEIWESKRPKYLRLGKGGESTVRLPEPKYIDGSFIYGKTSGKISIFVVGTILGAVADAIDEDFCNENKISYDEISIISLARLKPFPEVSKIQNYIADNVLLVAEASSVSGIAGSLYMEIAKTKKKYFNFESLSAPDHFAKKVGGADYLRKVALLDKDSIRNKIRTLIREDI